jgi:cardiolipin synthase
MTRDGDPALAPLEVLQDDPGLDRIVTVPNLVTAVRLACVPVFVWLLFAKHQQTGAALLLAGLGATDWVDGFVARRFKQVSNLGKVLDPTADRILVATAVISVIVHRAVPIWFAAATLGREVLVSVAVLLLAALGSKRIDVLFVGKAGTFALMTAYPLFLVSDGHHQWQHLLRLLAWGFAIPGIVLAWVAAASYVGPARRALAEGRARNELQPAQLVASGAQRKSPISDEDERVSNAGAEEAIGSGEQTVLDLGLGGLGDRSDHGNG